MVLLSFHFGFMQKYQNLTLEIGDISLKNYFLLSDLHFEL